jgi:hypothetical protein
MDMYFEEDDFEDGNEMLKLLTITATFIITILLILC